MSKSLIIVPTYNEIENIELLLNTVFQYVPDTHLLFVDDSSPDGTANEIRRIMEQYPGQIFLEERAKKEGLGKAYIHGFQWALKREYVYVFEMDADLSHPAKKLPEMMHELQQNDVVIGSRYLDGVLVKNWPLSRILLSRGASAYVKLITGLPVRDTTAGYVGYTREALNSLDLNKISFVGYAFQIEMKYKLWKKGFRLKEIPIVFTNREFGKSKMNGSIIWEAIYGVIYLKFKVRK